MLIYKDAVAIAQRILSFCCSGIRIPLSQSWFTLNWFLREKQIDCPIVGLSTEILSHVLVNGSLHQHHMPFWKHPK